MKREIQTKTPRKKRFTRAILSTVLLVVMGILYLLADRYLIEHVEITDVSSYAVYAAEATSTAVPAGEVTVSATPTSASSELPTAETEANATVYSDDWNYQSDTLSIAIRQVTSGSGQKQVTYFVADVILQDATQLASAFAEDKFGTNIIEDTSVIAGENDALFAINGDYYGFREDGILIRNGVIYRDRGARIGLAFYRDGSMKIYDETQTTAQELLDEGVWNTLSFGPALVEDSLVLSEFGATSIDTNLGNHTIEGNNPRTGVGIIEDNHFVFVVVDGRSPGYSRGVSLTEFAQIFADLGCTDAYNIDGGGSSTMYFMGRVVNNPLGKNKERGTSDILYVGS